MKYDNLLKNIKQKCLIIDIETWAEDKNGNEISINSKHDKYISYAKVKWFGAYSYKTDEIYLLHGLYDFNKIKELLATHNIIIGFNSEEFDFPILVNNGLISSNQKYIQVDCMQILGKSNFRNKAGYLYKNRGTLMDYKFKNNSLKAMAKEMECSVSKLNLDYHIFKRNKWTEDETKQIKEYLKNDIITTSELFDKLWEFWKPFTDMLDYKFVENLSWIRNSIASLTYKCACSIIGVEPTYSENKSKIEEMGGRVIMPKYEEAKGVWYIDYTSLYPHIMCMFNLLSENQALYIDNTWNGNDVFKVKGKYLQKTEHPLNRHIKDILKERDRIKKEDPDNPMKQTYKIFVNSLYGAVRSPIFEKVHTPNAGWDTCWLGQQISELTENMMNKFGFEAIYGDTDSLMLIAKDEKYNNREYIQGCLKKVIKKINENVLFPVDTFDIKIENYLDYIMFPFSKQPIQDENGNNIKEKNKLVKVRKGKKKNYLYIVDDEITLTGLPIKKDNATHLGIEIYEKELKPLILKNKSAKFDRKFIENIINNYLKKDGIMQLISREFKVKPYNSYKNSTSQLQAQISYHYFNNQAGSINLIKNKKIGKVGRGDLYCTVQEAIDNNLNAKDLCLEKLWNELEPFISSQ